jgi:Flp pilus assembly protein CpaB
MEHAQKLFSTRGGTMVLAGLAAVLAAIAVFTYIHNYRNSVQKGGTPATVLVAQSLIPKGTPGDAVATRQLYQAQTIRESQLREGAISDPVSLRGQVAATDILPGQQITDQDFTSAGGGLASELVGPQRAITIPIDSAHGMIGQLQDGDRVDVYAGFNVTPVDSLGRPTGGGQARQVLRLIMQRITVLDVSKSSRTGGTSANQITLRATPRQAAELAFASDNGALWFVLRPPTGATPSPPSIVTAETMLLGVQPVAALHSLGGRR